MTDAPSKPKNAALLASLRGLRQPAEWAPHAAVWTAYPWDPEAWLEPLPRAQQEFHALCRALGEHGGERLEILVPDAAVKARAERALAGVPCRFHEIPYGDSWLRDTAPVWGRDAGGALKSVCFRFNGWGDKYVMRHDDQVATRVAAATGIPAVHVPLVLEGGSIDSDGEGTALTTRQCLLNKNRNPDLAADEIERLVKAAYGLDALIWLDDGLLNDHTDGHIDNIARFVAPGRVVAMEARDADDPNREVLKRIVATLEAATDARGRKLEVVRLPSVGRYVGEDGAVMPASYMNFYIANRAVVVPVYGSRYDDEAVAILARLFPGRKVVGLRADAILTGGGSFHCITQQQPVARSGES